MTDSEIDELFDSANNIALVTGKLSGINIIDLDSYKKQFKNINISSQLIVSTPKSGRHMYFKHSEGLRPSTNNNLAIDIRAEGSYVLIPPSTNLTGSYTWGIKPNRTVVNKLSVIPPEIVQEVVGDVSTTNRFEIESAMNINEGSRNDTLYTTSVSLLSKYNPKTAWKLLNEFNKTANPPLSIKELQTLFNSAQRFVRSSPPRSPKQICTKTHKPFILTTDLVELDKFSGGFRSGNTYIMAGYEKSGKSSFLINVALNISKKEKITYINTELTEQDLLIYVNAIHTNTPKRDLEKSQNLKYPNENFIHIGLDQLIPTGKLEPSFDLLLAEMSKQQDSKAIFIDNLTTFSNQPNNNKKGWEILGRSLNQLVNYAKKTNTVIFPVIHTRQDTVLSERSGVVKTYIKNNTPEKIFDESISVIRKPTGSDIYGGGSARSQVSGTMILWRPFQLFVQSPTLPNMSALVLENFRHGTGGMVRMDFDGATSRFSEENVYVDIEKMKKET